jgi:hypothetical protein
MNAPTEPKTGLAKMREPFPAHQISKLPKPTTAQKEALKKDFRTGIRCTECGQWHHRDVVHLDYVGHAALTDRLLDCDPEWFWEPVALNPDGTPKVDGNGGMWIKLTVCGVTRWGYGHPDGKTGGNAIKEVIGDALRNAAMRFGAALDLWHKGDLHKDDDDAPPHEPPPDPSQETPAPRQKRSAAQPPAHRPDPAHDKPSPADLAISALEAAETVTALAAIWAGLRRSVQALPEVLGAKENRKAALQNDAAQSEATA